MRFLAESDSGATASGRMTVTSSTARGGNMPVASNVTLGATHMLTASVANVVAALSMVVKGIVKSLSRYRQPESALPLPVRRGRRHDQRKGLSSSTISAMREQSRSRPLNRYDSKWNGMHRAAKNDRAWLRGWMMYAAT
jgi:hypothetical protein